MYIIIPILISKYITLDNHHSNNLAQESDGLQWIPAGRKNVAVAIYLLGNFSKAGPWFYLLAMSVSLLVSQFTSNLFS